MSASSLQLNIRHAVPEDFDTIGKVHASALRNNQLYNTFYEKVSPDVARRWCWIDNAGGGVAKGQDTVLVLERADTKEIIGLAWFWKFDENRQPELPGNPPEGFNNDEFLKIVTPTCEWQKELLLDFEQYMFIQEFAIAPEYQSQGLGKVLLRHVIALAEKAGVNLALTAAQGKPGFYRSCGFKEVGDPLMYGPRNDLEGVTKMLWDCQANTSARG